MAAPAYHGTGVQNGITADLHMVAQHGAELFQAGIHFFFLGAHGNWGFILLHVGGDGTCAHMGAIAQDGISHIVVVGHLHMVEEDDVFQFCRVSHHAVGPYQSVAPDKGSRAHLGVRPDDAGPADIAVGIQPGTLVNPHIGPALFILVFRQGSPQPGDKGTDLRQGLPGIGVFFQQGGGGGMGQVKQVTDHQFVFHTATPSGTRSIFLLYPREKGHTRNGWCQYMQICPQNSGSLGKATGDLLGFIFFLPAGPGLGPKFWRGQRQGRCFP